MRQLWKKRRLKRRYADSVPARMAPVTRARMLDAYSGLWVAVIGDQVVAAAESSHQLALQLHNMDHRRRAMAVTEYVRPDSDVYIVGVG